MTSPRATRFAALGATALAAAYVVVRLLAVRTEGVNWDEFAVMHRTAAMLRTHVIQGGGRPGLVELVLAPFVRGCRNGVDAIVEARWVWAAFTVATFVALYHLVVQARASLAHRDDRWPAWAAVAAFALLPPVFGWSVQVRTDQPAVAFALWGSALLVASRTRPRLASAAGVLTGIGYLFTEKALYVSTIGLSLVAIELVRDDDRRRAVRDLASRLVVFSAGALVLVSIYRLGVSRFLQMPHGVNVGGQLSTFAHYRRIFGFKAYVALLPHLVPHIAVLVLFSASIVRGLAQRRLSSTAIGAIGLLLLGAAVGWFHAAAFPYFVFTLGLFPAAAIGLGITDALEVLPDRTRAIVGAALLVGVTGPWAFHAARVLRDTQSVQRDALEFVETNLPPEAVAYQVEGAFYCRHDPNPLPVLFRSHIEDRFGPKAPPAAAEAFRAEFEKRPVRAIALSYMLAAFPGVVQELWMSRYVRYHGPVALPGHRVLGMPGTKLRFDAIATDRYRFRAAPGDRISIDGKPVGGGEVTTLGAGPHEIEVLTPRVDGLLHLEVPSAPTTSDQPFYPQRQLDEINGEGY